MKYQVIRKGGSIGMSPNHVVAEFTDKEEAKATAKRYRKMLTPGERSYYGMSYVVKPVKL